MKFIVLALSVSMACAGSLEGGAYHAGRTTADVASKPFTTAAHATAGFGHGVANNAHSGLHGLHKRQTKDAEAPVLRSESDVKPDGFNYAYETGNGIAGQAEGTIKVVDNEPSLSVRGQFQYNSPDGTPVQFEYLADENGYQPNSAALPVGPEIPVAIARALEWAKAHPYVEKH